MGEVKKLYCFEIYFTGYVQKYKKGNPHVSSLYILKTGIFLLYIPTHISPFFIF